MPNTFPRPTSKARLKEQVRSEWNAWRLVLSGKFSYDEAFNYFTPEIIDKANIALDLEIEAEKNAAKTKK